MLAHDRVVLLHRELLGHRARILLRHVESAGVGAVDSSFTLIVTAFAMVRTSVLSVRPECADLGIGSNQPRRKRAGSSALNVWITA